MTYTNEMVLPRNFAQHSEDEMMYLDGGATTYYRKISFRAIGAVCTVASFLATGGMAAVAIYATKLGVDAGLITIASSVATMISSGLGLGGFSLTSLSGGLTFTFQTTERTYRKGSRTYTNITQARITKVSRYYET